LKHQKVMDRKAVVFGLFETGLGVARSLGKEGVRVIGVDFKKDIAWYSKYVKPNICPHPIEQEEQFLEWIEKKFEGTTSKLPVFFTADNFAYAFAKNWNYLQKYFLLNWVEFSFLEKIADKYEQYVLAKNAEVNVPYSSIFKSMDDFDTNKLGNHSFPIFIKGLDVNKWRKNVSGTIKGFKADNLSDATIKIKEILDKDTPIIVQDIVEGSDDKHYKYCVYIDTKGEIAADFSLQKIRQNPIHFGVGASVQSIHNEELVKEGKRLFKGIGYKGIGSAEFKLDKNGRFQLIEINPRYWQQNYLSTYCGINFPYINYCDLLNLPIPEKSVYKENVKWVNRYMDFDSFLKYRKEGTLNYWTWRKSVRRPKTYADFTWSDPIPALFEIGFGLKLLKLPIFIFKKIFGRG
jgi:D-aspartate ligase